MNKVLITILSLFFLSSVFAQTKRDSSITFPMFTASYSIQLPGGDMKDRFGYSSSVGTSFMVKTKSNWLFATEFDFIFGNKIKEDSMFNDVRTSTGEFINIYGEFAKVVLTERGFFIGGKIGRIIPILPKSPNSGILICLRAGLLQHKIRIDNDGNNTPYILNDYKKGYDRLTNGLAIGEFVGFIYVSKKHLYNIYAGFEFNQAFTQNRRSVNFDTMKADNTKRLDLLHTFKVAWIIPIYKKQPLEFYYD